MGNNLWTKQAAIERVKSNDRLQFILGIEPRLKYLIGYVMLLENHFNYRSHDTYLEIKSILQRLVGWYVPKEAGIDNEIIRDSRVYDVVLDALLDLLPPDEIDLYPDGHKAGMSSSYTPDLDWRYNESNYIWLAEERYFDLKRDPFGEVITDIDDL